MGASGVMSGSPSGRQAAAQFQLISKFLLVLSCLGSNSIFASAPELQDRPQLPQCRKVRFSDVGWTDITASTAVAGEILSSLGYEFKSTVLSVPVTYMSLKNKDIDVFLGNWMPSMAADIKPYQQDGSVETISALVKDARYTLAVPTYVQQGGVRGLEDLARFKDKFRGRIYGLEPGNDGNRLVQKMVTDNAYGIAGWKLIESSEQAMLMEVMRSVRKGEWIVFLGWEPHPMNQKVQMSYLRGGENYFGSSEGKSTVYVNTRKGYSKECPQVARFLKNYKLKIASENELMSLILDEKLDSRVAAKKWMGAHFQMVEPWVKGMRTWDGKQDATELLRRQFGV